MMIESLKENFAYQFEPALIEEISESGNLIDVKEGEILIEIGDYLRSMPLLVSGAIKILREDDEGDELLLYFIEKGATCAMTLTCCLGNTRSEIRAIAELDTTLIMLPIQKMEEWMTKYKSWRNFVLASYHGRLMEMLDTIDSIAFMKLDERLIKYLKDKEKISGDSVINSTHQEIAYELYTSRVVVSRLLKKLENLGKIELNRNSIKILSL